eukprot:TRINITY_DN2155_c0_g1_i1.p1 TRINITY_DN2155_c0_g1~~TRINITY_DN2155_c0_g1_i1.p1  ORF type:complete len:210 (+),score=54.05 TRINITY_DN2155_c0_g1_i1:100-729(+)
MNLQRQYNIIYNELENMSNLMDELRDKALKDDIGREIWNCNEILRQLMAEINEFNESIEKSSDSEDYEVWLLKKDKLKEKLMKCKFDHEVLENDHKSRNDVKKERDLLFNGISPSKKNEFEQKKMQQRLQRINKDIDEFEKSALGSLGRMVVQRDQMNRIYGKMLDMSDKLTSFGSTVNTIRKRYRQDMLAFICGVIITTIVLFFNFFW